MTNRDRIIEHKKVLSGEAAILKKRIAKAPPGILVCYQNRNYVKWYQEERDEKTRAVKRKYIPKKKKDLAVKLAAKTADMRRLKDIDKELAAIDLYLSAYDPQKNSLLDLLERSPAFRELLVPEPAKDAYVQAWLSEEYEKNPSHPEHLQYKTITGEYVRSKSEANIYYMLTILGIPFRYEAPLKVGNQTIYPDFTILRMRDRKIVYLEHFGKIGEPGYEARNISRIKTFISAGIYPWDRLFITYESEDHPYDYDEIMKIIEFFIL